jgi:hypothetical protein
VSGTTAADSSGHGNNGSSSGSVALGQPGAPAFDSDTAIRLGSGSPAGLITVPDSASLDYGDTVTIEAWVRLLGLPPTGSTGANIATKDTGTLVARILPSGVVSLRKSGVAEIVESTAAVPVDGMYHQVVAVKSGTNVHIYLDGVDVTGTVNNQTLANNTQPLTVAGDASTGAVINGYLDELSIYGRGLSATEVANHYAAGHYGACSPISGATAATYTATTGDDGSGLQVAVTASNSAGSATALSSSSAAVTSAVSSPPSNTSPPTISGLAQQGQTLTASTGTWSGTQPISYAYQWQRCDVNGGSCGNIASATNTTYTLTSGDLGSTIGATVTASNSSGQSTATSTQTPTVVASGSDGYIDQSFSGAGDVAPSGSKPESKLWWNDGSWWADMWSSSASSFDIFRLNVATQHWIDTGVRIDNRPGTRADALWDGSHLYVASHVFSTCGCSVSAPGNPAYLYRYSYNPSSKTYSLDSGFPVQIDNTSSETLVIDKDSTGTLWATWAQDDQVEVEHTIGGNDATWGSPFVLPVSGASNLNTDDISSSLAFGGNKIGIMWSNQTDSAMYFSVHVDGDPDSAWTASRSAVPGPNLGNADDHLNLKSLQTDGSGRVFAAVKTSLTDLPNPNPNAPLIMLLVRDPSTGDWTNYVFSTIGDNETRPIVLLDTQNNIIHMFATGPESGGSIYEKTSPLNSISFASGLGTPVIQDGTSAAINNATSTKQNVNSTTGLVVLATNSTTGYYWHNYESLGP